jgi:tetratricopeptide (TPR) repeat protein
MFISSPSFALPQNQELMTTEGAVYFLQKQWAIANYKTTEKEIENTFEQLITDAEAIVKKYPNRAEPLVWNAIIVSTYAGKTGGLGALSKVKQARELLLMAEKISSDVLQGSIYTSLGSLYYQVPGWPLAFGDDNKAELYLKKALAINPNGIDANYFYGDFLIEEGNYQEAKTYLTKALNAPARPKRPIADTGRRAEIAEKLNTIANK